MIRDQRLVRFAREWASLMVSAEEGEPTATNATELEKRTQRLPAANFNQTNDMKEHNTENKTNTEPPSGRVRRLVVRKFILILCVLWMIPWYLLTQVLRAILCVTVGAQNLWWHPIRGAKDSWDSNA